MPIIRRIGTDTTTKKIEIENTIGGSDDVKTVFARGLGYRHTVITGLRGIRRQRPVARIGREQFGTASRRLTAEYDQLQQ